MCAATAASLNCGIAHIALVERVLDP